MADTKAVAADPRATKCLTKEELLKYSGEKGLVLNSDGTVSVYYNNPELGLYPVQLTLECCKVLDPKYYFDINTQTCRWAEPHDTCGFSEPINLIVNPKENDGTLFFIDDFQKETCDLKISFDYLLKIKCEDLLNIANPTIATNIQSQETIKEIVKTEMEIEYINSQIETITNQIVELNTEYLNTPYSMECAQFPVVITTPDPINCAVSAWSAWSTCVNGAQTQTRTITTQPQYGGTTCPVLSQTQSCTSGPCVPPANMTQIGFLYSHANTIFTGSESSACAAAQFSDNLFAAYLPYLVNGILAVGVKVYSTNTSCALLPDGYYITNQSTKQITHVVQGIVVSITNCAAAAAACYTYNVQTAFPGNVIYTSCVGTPNQIQYVNGNASICARAGSIMGATSATQQGSCNTTAKVAAFDKSGFSAVATDPTANLDVYQKGSTTTYIYVNYCLTDAGLLAWESILNASGGSYQGFILGNPTSYTCADVIKLSQQPNAAQLFYDCDVPFGTKSEIWVQITELTTKLTVLNTQLTTLENQLIKLQNTFTTSTTSTKGCTTMIDALESLDIEMHLDIVNADNSLTSVFSAATFPAINSTTNLYDYLVNNTNSGFYICGDPSKDNVGFSDCTTLSLDDNVAPNVDSCNSIVENLIDGLIKESGSDINNISYNAFASKWLNYSMLISDPAIIGLITNKKIKISFKINFSCIDFCLLLDNLVLDKSCKSVDRNDITISQNPGFDLKRVIDNKKSWIDNTSPTNREFLISKSNGTNPIRRTDYDVNDERLVINSKEIDLDISVASAIETDVWCYLNDNSCALTAACTSTIASTNNNPIIDGQTIVFSGTPVSIDNCNDYNGILANRTANFIQTTVCGTILRFRVKTGFPATIVYYWLVQQPNGDVEFYFQDSTSFFNLSNVYQNGKECCEYLNVDLQTYNKAASQADDFEVYWDEDCQRCKVEKARCGDINLDFHSLVTEPISGVTTIEQFENLMVTELIDVKNRQTITSYPTLRAIYDRYLHSSDYCGTVSSAFDYQNMDRFANLVGNYWIDLIEQVVPSTTIWGSVKIYTNTIFDEQKFKYKSYSSLLCNNPFQGQHVLSPINGVDGECQHVNVIYKDLLGSVKTNTNWFTTNQIGELVMLSASEQPRQALPSELVLDTPRPRPRIKSPINVCDNLCIAQMNSGSEFISYIPFETPIIKEPCVNCENETIPVGNEPGDGVFNSNYTRFYVANKSDSTVSVIDTTSNLVIAIITIPITYIRYLSYASDYNKLYVTSEQDDTLTVIDCNTNLIIGTPIPTGNEPRTTTYVPYNKYLYSYDQYGITVVDTYDDTVVTNINLSQPNGAYNGTYNPDKRYIYTFNIQDDTISVIDVVTNTIVTTVSTDIGPSWGYYHSNNRFLYFINVYDETCQFMDTNTNQIIGSVSVETDPSSITFNPDNNCLYVANELSSTVTVINTITNSVFANIPVDPRGINTIYVPLNQKIYVDNEQGSTINALTTTNYDPLFIINNEAIPVGSNPNGLFYNPINESIYVVNSGSANVTVLKCLTQKKFGDLNIKACDLEVTIVNQGDHDGEILLVAQTVGGTLPFTYIWSNGETTPEIYVTEPKNISVRVTDANCCSKTAQYELSKKTACWYTMPENGVQLMMTFMCQVYPDKNATTITIDSLIVNGSNDYIGSVAPSISLNTSNLLWIDANTTNYDLCNSANPGKTYTNFVTFLNELFIQYGLTNYKAQNSLIDKPYSSSISNNASCGMYIIRPSDDTFSIKITTHSYAQGTITMTYTQDTVYDEWGNPWMYGSYKNIICSGINYDEATNSVIE